MREQDFASLVDAGLLREVEEIVVAAHRDLYRRQGKPWSRPAAYRWLRYEDPEPVQRLSEGVDKLARSGARFDQEAVEKACAEAEKLGFSI